MRHIALEVPWQQKVHFSAYLWWYFVGASVMVNEQRRNSFHSMRPFLLVKLRLANRQELGSQKLLVDQARFAPLQNLGS